MLTKVAVRGLLSFGPAGVEVELGALNVLVGANGSGKSNFFEALRLLRALPEGLPEHLRRGGSAADWLHHGQREAGLRYELAAAPGERALAGQLSLSERAGALALQHEALAEAGHEVPALGVDKNIDPARVAYLHASGVGRAGARVPVEGQEGQSHRVLTRLAFDPERSAFQQLRDPSRYPEVTATARQLGRMRFYRDWAFGPESPLRRGQSAATMSGELLDEDGANLGLALHELRTFPEAWARVKSAMALLYTGCDDLHVSFAGGTVQFFVLEGERRHKIPAARASDGTLRYLALIALLCHPTPPPLLCIDEPELGLHPYLMASIATMLRDASTRTQLLVSTHSEGLLAALGDLRDQLLVFERSPAGTTLRRGL